MDIDVRYVDAVTGVVVRAIREDKIEACLSYEFVAMSLVNDANSNEGEKLDPENEADLIDLTSATENISEDETGSSSPLVDLHACGICFQPYNDSERLPKVLSCGHTNCLACLNSWVKHGSSVFPVCAVCRKITHKPVYLLPNNFQLLEVLRRMKLVSMDSPPTFPEQPQNAYSATGSSASEMDAVCEKIDVGHNMALRTVEHSIATFLQQWQSTRRCLRFTNNPKFYPRESGSITDLMDLVDLMYADGVFEDDFDFSSHDSLSRSPPGEERPYEYLGSSVSDILPEDFDFSLFEGDNQEAVVSVSLSSSPDDNFPGSDEQVESFTFPYITSCPCNGGTSDSRYLFVLYTMSLSDPKEFRQLSHTRSREGNPSGRGRPYNRHRNRHQTRRTHIGFGASGQNTGSRNTPIRMSTSVGVENDTGRIIPSGSPSWLEFAPQRGNDITDDRSSWRDSAETIVANASDRPSGIPGTNGTIVACGTIPGCTLGKCSTPVGRCPTVAIDMATAEQFGHVLSWWPPPKSKRNVPENRYSVWQF
uniref:RING-type domain-containing protein n=1 Tax=Angiostrongylus cantonensis TaxID=6313 RepID=A0A0K0DET3_ANGCA